MKKINKILLIVMFSLCFHNTFLFSNKRITQQSIRYLDKASFLSVIGPAAVADMKETGVYASVTIGQSAVESGWGKNAIATVYGNYFGMKAGGKVYVNGVETQCNASNRGVLGNSKNSNQFWSGMAVCLPASEGGYAWFRVYDGVYNSVKDHSRNLWCISDGRYIKNGVFEATSSSQQIYAIAASGYASNPTGYYNDVYNTIINPNSLTQYDSGYQKVKPSYAYDCTTAEYSGVMPTIPEGVSNDNRNLLGEYMSAYNGDMRNGYIYLKQLGNAITNLESQNDSTLSNKISNIISNIFNKTTENYNSSNYEIVISGDETEASNWRQSSPSWGSISLGNSRYSISSAGCLATSVAIQMKLSGTTINSDNFNPGTFVQYLNGNNGFTSGGLFIWDSSKWRGLAPNFVVTNSAYNLPKDKNGKLQAISSLLSQGYYPVMCVKKNCGHWVAVTGVSGDNINIIDPGSNAKQAFPTYNVSNVTRVALFKKSD